MENQETHFKPNTLFMKILSQYNYEKYGGAKHTINY